jgi:hypothetical protein
MFTSLGMTVGVLMIVAGILLLAILFLFVR